MKRLAKLVLAASPLWYYILINPQGVPTVVNPGFPTQIACAEAQKSNFQSMVDANVPLLEQYVFVACAPTNARGPI